MTLTRDDLRKLLVPLVITAALLVIASLLAWRSSQSSQLALRDKLAAEGRRATLEQRLMQASNEEQELKLRADQFQRLQQSGMGGGENRLAWTELLRDLQKSLRIPGMSYEFGIQKPLDPKYVDKPGYAFSPMRLRLSLLHEGDLINFLSRLQSQAPALVLLRSCKLAPMPKSEDALVQLQADCELHWVSLHRPDTGK